MLSVPQRRVLVLRAGLGPRERHSRRATAAALDLPLARVRHRERAGLRRLRALAGGCGVAPATRGRRRRHRAHLGHGHRRASARRRDRAEGSDPGDRDRSAVLGERDELPSPDGGVTPATLIPEGASPAGAGDASVYVLAALALLLIALLGNRRSRDWILRPG